MSEASVQGFRWAPSRLLFLSALPVLAVVSLMIGVADFSLTRLDAQDWQLLLISRLPRTLALILTGMALAVAGVIMQMLARNPFVEPGTTGTLEAALLGMLLVSLLAPGVSVLVRMLVACTLALASSLVFLGLLNRIPLRSTVMVPLIGIMYGGVVGALATFLAYRFNMLQSLGNWSNGDFSAILRGRYELLWLGAGLCLVAYAFADRFTAASLGKQFTLNLGLSYQQLLFAGLLIVSLISAVTVVTAGVIPFVGLVVPNLIRLRFGDHLRHTLPWVAYTGALLVVACDILARTLRFPYELPLGTVIGLIGSVFFIFLILRGTRHGQIR